MNGKWAQSYKAPFYPKRRESEKYKSRFKFLAALVITNAGISYSRVALLISNIIRLNLAIVRSLQDSIRTLIKFRVTSWLVINLMS